MSNAEQGRAGFLIFVFPGPKIERNGRQLIDQGNGIPVFGHINRLQICVARVASIDSHVLELFGRENRKLIFIFLAAARTDYSAKRPLRKAEGTDQRSLASISF